jgi:hypothetical protein
MNATEVKYNPFRAAAQVAFSELSSDQAQHFYSLKAQEDIQSVLDASVTVCAWVFQIAELTYAMGAQCRVWCDDLEINAQATALALPILATVEDPWEIEADYEWVEFSPSVAAQADISPTLLLASASPMVCESGNQTPKDIKCIPATLLALRGRGKTQAKQESTLDVGNEPGATGGQPRKPKAKASTSKTAATKPKGVRAKAGANGGK